MLNVGCWWFHHFFLLPFTKIEFIFIMHRWNIVLTFSKNLSETFQEANNIHLYGEISKVGKTTQRRVYENIRCKCHTIFFNIVYLWLCHTTGTFENAFTREGAGAITPDCCQSRNLEYAEIGASISQPAANAQLRSEIKRLIKWSSWKRMRQTLFTDLCSLHFASNRSSSDGCSNKSSKS